MNIQVGNWGAYMRTDKRPAVKHGTAAAIREVGSGGDTPKSGLWSATLCGYS